MNSYIILWKIDEGQDFCFEADMKANDSTEARAKFARMFPNDVIVGVKEARINGWF